MTARSLLKGVGKGALVLLCGYGLVATLVKDLSRSEAETPKPKSEAEQTFETCGVDPNGVEWHGEGVAEDAIRRQLKSPTTARFSGEAFGISASDCSIQVTGDVNAQNAFGAMVQSRWVVRLRQTERNRFAVDTAVVTE